MSFESFEDAHMKLGLEGSPRYNVISSTGIISLKITDGLNSYNKVLNGGNIVWFTGIGPKSAEGIPIRNQLEEKQAPFFVSQKYGTVFPILREKGGSVDVLGNYRIIDIIKKVTSSGFIYYHIKMYRAYDKPFFTRAKIDL